jgi:hypothetical protein
VRFVTKAVLAAAVALTCLLAVSACGSGMSGSWVPSPGSVVWIDSQAATGGTTGFELGGKATRPGGLIISNEGGGYKVTLVSRDGSRYGTSAKIDGARLGVTFGGQAAPFFYLTQTASDTLAMYEQVTGAGVTTKLVHVTDFKPGSP